MKKQGHSLFLVFILILLVGLLEMNHLFRRYFSDKSALVDQVSRLEKSVQKEKLKLAISQNQLLDFQTEVAGILEKEDPKVLSRLNYKKSQILGTIRLPASTSTIDLSATLMARGKSDFSQKKYLAAIETFKEVIRRYPTSASVIESHFMLAESYYLANKPEDCLDVVDQMMVHYPESDLTGFIMLRMGQILQYRKRAAEAARVYQIVIEKFNNNDVLRKQAQELLRSTEV